MTKNKNGYTGGTGSTPGHGPLDLITVELSERQFEKISRMVYRLSGIHLKNGKQALVRARLMKRLRALKIRNFRDYLKYLDSASGKDEPQRMIDVITTNKTHFFREPAHFDYLKTELLPQYKGNRLRFWTAACSSGEETYSLAILLREHLPNIDGRDVKILATDISRRMLERAQLAVYSADQIKDVPPLFIQRYFNKISDRPTRQYQLRDEIRRIVTIAWLNLIDNWPMKGPFDVIFCRNVMIYFDRTTQQRLIQRFSQLLGNGGHLFVGHSEGLSAISHNLNYVGPAIYRK